MERFDKEIDSIDEAFDKLKGKVKRLSRKWRASKNEEDSSDNGSNGSEVGSKNPKRTTKLDSDRTDYEKFNEESDSSLSEDEFEKRFDVQTDWYIPQSDIKNSNIKSIIYH